MHRIPHLRPLLLAALFAAAALAAPQALRATDVSITAANVVPSASALVNAKRATAGATIAAGQIIYLDTGDSHKAKLADANGATALIRTPVGMAINSASAGQFVNYIDYDDDLTIGTHSQSVNGVVILSATAGGVAPLADITTGWYGVVLGVAKSSTKIVFNVKSLMATGASS